MPHVGSQQGWFERRVTSIRAWDANVVRNRPARQQLCDSHKVLGPPVLFLTQDFQKILKHSVFEKKRCVKKILGLKVF